MKKILIIALTLIGCAVDNTDYERCGSSLLEGEEAYSYVVRLESKHRERNYSSCTGVIIDNKAVLTAKHCVDNKRVDILADNRETVKANKIYMHPKVDLAIVKTDEDMFLPIAELPKIPGEKYIGSILNAPGYGDRNTKDYGAVLLFLKNNKFLVGNEPNSKICFGDSGGPLLACDTIVGISSEVLADNKDRCTGTAMFVDIYDNIEWVRDILINQK